MIQRIQTLFLALAAACAFGLFGLPFATTNTNVATSGLFSDSVYNLQDNVALIGAFSLAGALTLISIFLFKNRKTQLLLGRFGIIANIIGIVLVFVFIMQDPLDAHTHDINEEIGIVLPILFLVFAALAQRGIMKDDKLVKSMDRLR